MYVRATGKWLELPDMPTPVDGATAVSSGNSVIVVGGTEARGNIIEEFNLETRQWRPLSRLVQKTTHPLVATNGDCLYIIMNNSNPMHAMSMQCYDIASDTWQLRKLPEELQITKGACVVVLAGELFVVGGTERLCMRYRRAHDVWLTCARPSQVHRHGAAVALGAAIGSGCADGGAGSGGQIMLCGGWDEAGHCQRTVEVYDVRDNKWALSDVRLPAGLRSHLCVIE
jgi:N-acetylneuraminic acid mutarotase